ncbi:hypothetical protein RJ639_026592 [Escallonia herrerae]|uniref:Uncharacterized protein n=1 Tax=Escallonia herrerae TaxID=1293975 RepID=A0AA88UTN9_9ASTE|nr:hypothetical protein RJ639_026592 [Escallonia herrerae]
MAMSKLIGVFVITLLICSFFQAATTANVRTYRTMLKEILKEKSREIAPSPTYRVPAEILKEKPHENVPSLTYREPANPYTRGCSMITRCRATTANVRTYRTMLKEILKEKSREIAPSPTYRVPAEILKEKPHENVPSLTYREPANPYTRGCSMITRCRGGPPRS